MLGFVFLGVVVVAVVVVVVAVVVVVETWHAASLPDGTGTERDGTGTVQGGAWCGG